MQLNKQTDFAFRTLIFLAAVPEGKLSNIAQVCDYFDISANHLSKVVNKLSRLGYVQTVRGKNGGILLSRPAGEIGLAAVVRDMEPSMSAVNCSEPPCRISPQCKLKQLLNNATTAFIEYLEDYTLADISVKAINKDLTTVLKLP